MPYECKVAKFLQPFVLRKALRLFVAVCRRVIGANFSLQSQQMPHSLLVTSQIAEVWLNTPHRSITANGLFSSGYTACDWVIGKKANFWGIEKWLMDWRKLGGGSGMATKNKIFLPFRSPCTNSRLTAQVRLRSAKPKLKQVLFGLCSRLH